MYAIGIDIGGTKIAGAVVDENGCVLHEQKIPTNSEDPRGIEDGVVTMVNELSERSEQDIIGVGVAAAGFINAEQSVVYYAPNINWRQEPFRDRLHARMPYPVVIENDANAAGWAEYRFGAGRGVQDMVMITIGTGVGGAVITSGRLFRGGHGVGGELGHMCVEPGGLLCGCGARGCIEQYASGRALQRYANEIADAAGIGLELARVRAANSGHLSGVDIGRLVLGGDLGAVEALHQLCKWIGQACASFSAILDPNLFVFGGGVSAAGQMLLDPIRASYFEHLAAKDSRPMASFAIAQLVNSAGVIGAADLVRLSVQGQ